LAFNVIRSAERGFQGILERSPISESVFIIIKPLPSCSGKIENDVRQTHLFIPMVIGGDSLKFPEPPASILLVFP
jgi:hypothetical protein